MNLSDKERQALARAPHIIDSIPSSYERRPAYWQHIDEATWQSPLWQFDHRITSAQALAPFIALTPDEITAIERTASSFSMAISPHFIALMRDEYGAACPIRRQAIPTTAELLPSRDLLSDPLGERPRAIAPCAIHRYPDRALIYATPQCAMRCRHCTRRTRVGSEECVTQTDRTAAIDAICADENIRDVLISGGDPLALSNETLESIIAPLRACPHIDIIRLCTRMVSTMPQRFFDHQLIEMLSRYAPIYVNTQFNHPFEATRESIIAMKHLRSAGCILGNQSVLLKNINDNADDLEALYRFLTKHGCRPYYLFLCDVAQGTDHFRTTIDSGLVIMKHLRGRLSGLSIPHFVIDLPNGYGKVDLAPNSIVERDGRRIVFDNWFGEKVTYFEPQ